MGIKHISGLITKTFKHIKILDFSPRPLFVSPTTPSRLHSAGCPHTICTTRSCGEGAGRRFYGALRMNGYPAVPECGVDVVFVSRRRLLKYIIKEMYMAVPCHRSPTGRQVAANRATSTDRVSGQYKMQEYSTGQEMAVIYCRTNY